MYLQRLKYESIMISQGVYLGNKFYPMTPINEGSAHELYLRATQASKPLAPLKLYANILGKFAVEPKLDTKMQDKVRDRTQEVERQRTDRQAIMLETPPDMARAKKPKIAAVSSSSSRSKKISKALNVTARSIAESDPAALLEHPSRHHLIRYLAVAPRTLEDALRLVSGDIPSSASESFRQVLEDVSCTSETGQLASI